MEVKKDCHHLFRIIMVGDAGVGKSSILMRFADDNFIDSYVSTIGVDFRFKTIIANNKVIKMQIWDTAGQERFRTITSAYYRGADAVILCYDITDEDSFDHIEEWMTEVHRASGEKLPILIVGNKCDLHNNRVISEEIAHNFAVKHNCGYIETSARTSENIDKIFLDIAKKILQNNIDKDDNMSQQKTIHDNKKIVITDKKRKNGKENKCCQI